MAFTASQAVPVYGRLRSVHLCSQQLRHSPRVTTLRPRGPLRFPVCQAPTEAELDPVAAEVRAELASNGINMDELLNAGRVVSLTRKLQAVEGELSGGASAEKGAKLLVKREKLESELAKEKRLVMKLWLKRVFLAQAMLFAVAGGLLSTDHVPFVQHVPLVGQALGFWLLWLFTIPALRARKGIWKAEKSALNVAFLGMPVVNVLVTFLTKRTGVIWGIDVGLLLGCYAWYVGRALVTDREVRDGESGGESVKVKGLLKYIDWGSWR